MKRINKTEEYMLYYDQFLALQEQGRLKEGSIYHILDLPDGLDLVEGKWTVKKAEQDAEGNIIHETYVKRLDLDYQVVDSLPADKTAGKMIYLKDGEFNLSNLKISNGNEYTSFVPTKTSDLTNDSQFATKDYVEQNGGKIDKILVNEVEQEIVDKAVKLTIDKTAIGLSNVDNTSDLDKPISTATRTALNTITDKIPAQASSTNQLADKDFVNSSINSYAATFKGSYATKAELDAIEWQTEDAAQSTYVTNNDYAYIEADESHNNEAWRYIYVKDGTTSAWQPQFKVNDTPFTAEQLAAINSNATADVIAQIGTNTQAIIDNSNKFDNYLPLTAGIENKVTGALYLNEGSIIANAKGYQSYDTSGNVRSLIKLTDSNKILLGDSNTSSAIISRNSLMPVFGKALSLGDADNQWTEVCGVNIYQNGNRVADKQDLYLKQDTINDLDTIRSGASAGATAVQPSTLTSYYTKTETDELLNDKVTKTTKINNKPLSSNINLTASDIGALSSDTELFSGSYNDLTNKPNLFSGNYNDLSNKPTLFSGNYNDLTNKPTIPTTASQVGALPNTTNYGASLSLSINTSTYVLTAQLKDQAGNNLGTAQTIDLPLESVVVSGNYDAANKKVILTLKDNSTIDFSVADLVSGLIPDTRKIAGIDLKDDITAEELSTALNLSQCASAVTSVNGKTGIVSLTAGDVGALPDTTAIPKLYNSIGENADGAIDQATMTSIFENLDDVLTDIDNKASSKYTKPATGIPASDLAESYIKYDENSSVDSSDLPNADYLLKSAVVQSTGTSTTSVMSQKAVTDAINEAIQQSIIRALGGSY